MEEMSKHGRIGQAAMKSDMDRKTARKYVAGGKLPSELKPARDWRTRPDPFVQHWPEIEERLRITPELEAKTLFELLQEQHPERYQDGQLRTLQRRVRWWRAARGPEQEIMLAQLQTDFTSTMELAVTIAGQLFSHLLCVLVLPYSNWQWTTVCLSESIAAQRLLEPPLDRAVGGLDVAILLLRSDRGDELREGRRLRGRAGEASCLITDDQPQRRVGDAARVRIDLAVHVVLARRLESIARDGDGSPTHTNCVHAS